MRVLAGGVCALLLAALIPEPLAAAAPCERLSALALPDATITLARTVDAGAFAPGGSAAGDTGPAPQALNAPRAFCRVAATLRPTSDSDIKIELWMPAADWNGKFQAVGNGAFSGTIAYPAMTPRSAAATPPVRPTPGMSAITRPSASDIRRR